MFTYLRVYLTYAAKLKTMDVEEAIRGRRSVRDYTTQDVSVEDADALLEAGCFATIAADHPAEGVHGSMERSPLDGLIL
jgi:hypothetical protein